MLGYSSGFRPDRRQRLYDAWNNRVARKAYKRLVATEPHRKLTADQRREIKSYAASKLGGTIHAPWLYYIAAFRGAFVENCIPPTYTSRYILPPPENAQRHLLSRTIARRVLGTDRFPDVAFVFNGQLFDLNGDHLSPKNFARQIFDQHPFLYLKEEESVRGLGVKRTQAEAFAADIAQAQAAVLQTHVASHPDLLRFSPQGTPTVRVHTIQHDGNVYATSGILRMGRQGEGHVQSATQISVAIDIHTGRLHHTGMVPDYAPTKHHPDTGLVFDGETVYGFDAIVDLCKDLQRRAPFARFTGWDATVTPDGKVMLYEANNGHNVLVLPEASFGPILGEFGWHELHLQKPFYA
ncbi:MAG: sugar-transfer associated ATP-grasp domain-containing protein [Pseudomonadota bacterium]